LRILYLSCHEILEYDELCLLTELGHEVFSPGGAYANPVQSGGFMRSVIPKGQFYDHLYSVSLQCSKDRLHPELIDWADVILSMHNPRLPGQRVAQPWIVNNWSLFRRMGKPVVWRSIGQSVPAVERELSRFVEDGLKIVRYSPFERNLPDYAGEDAMIRFYKDPDEFHGWTGEYHQVITVAQSMKQRGEHLGYSLFERVTANFNAKIFGINNSDCGELNGGKRSYNELKQDLRENRAFFYFGTQPASYTLGFIEAWMTGIPVVAVGSPLRETGLYPRWLYEVPDLIDHGANGLVGETHQELVDFIDALMGDYDYAVKVGNAGRKSAIEHFGKEKIMKQWDEFLGELS
jgi:hypothetical protein